MSKKSLKELYKKYEKPVLLDVPGEISYIAVIADSKDKAVDIYKAKFQDFFDATSFAGVSFGRLAANRNVFNNAVFLGYVVAPKVGDKMHHPDYDTQVVWEEGFKNEYPVYVLGIG